MTEGGFEEILFGTVFQQWVVHRVGSNLDTIKSCKMYYKCQHYQVNGDGECPSMTHKFEWYPPVRRSQQPSGTAPTEHSKPPPSADTCWQN